jgi:hypothetical protein
MVEGLLQKLVSFTVRSRSSFSDRLDGDTLVLRERERRNRVIEAVVNSLSNLLPRSRDILKKSIPQHITKKLFRSSIHHARAMLNSGLLLFMK